MPRPRGKRAKHPDMEKALHADEELDEARTPNPAHKRVSKAVVAKKRQPANETLHVQGRPEAGVPKRTFNKERLQEYLGVSNQDLKKLGSHCRFVEGGKEEVLAKSSIYKEKPSEPEPAAQHHHDDTPQLEQEEDTKNDIEAETGGDGLKSDKATAAGNENIPEISAPRGGTDATTSRKPTKRVVKKRNKNARNNQSPIEDSPSQETKKSPKRVVKKKNKKTRKNKKQRKIKCLKPTYSKHTQTDPIILPDYIPEGDDAEPTGEDTDDRSANLFNIISPQQGIMEPGKDILITVKVFSAFVFEEYAKAGNEVTSIDHFLQNNPHLAIFHYSMVLTGRHKISDIRDYFVCNENGTTEASSRSGFLLSQNAFFVDYGNNAAVHEQAVLEWRLMRHISSKRKFNIETRLDQMVYTLGHPDMYVHGPSCEHLVFFTDIRLSCAEDPSYVSDYPRVISKAHRYGRPNCYRCSELNPPWIVYDCDDLQCKEGFYCQLCLRTMLYDETGRRLFKFKVRKYNPMQDGA